MAGDQNEQSGVAVAFEIFECPACGSDPGRPSYRRPGDSLEGRVVVSTKSTLQFGCVEVLFQGVEAANVIVYSWEYAQFDLPSSTKNGTTVKANNTFMSIKYSPSLDSIQQHNGENGLKQYSFSFSFVIPSVFGYPQDNIPSYCCTLPPSFDTARQGSIPRQTYPLPALSITYELRARIRYRENDDTTPRRAEAREAVNIFPYSSAEPPTHTEDFPGEFVLSGATTLWKHAVGGRLGSVDVRASEPLPLIYSPSTPFASTECTLSITVHPVRMPLARLRNLSFDVKPAIRVKTFYSTTPMRCIPRQADLTRKTPIRLHDDVIKLEERRFSDIEWEYKPAGIAEDTPPPYEEARAEEGRPSASSGSRSSWSSSQHSSGVTLHGRHGGHHSRWRASVKLAIKPPETLVSAFCTRLIARSYSLAIRVRVSGAYGKNCDLELPLQLVYSPPLQSTASAIADEVSGPCEGPDALLAQDTLPAYDASTTACMDRPALLQR